MFILQFLFQREMIDMVPKAITLTLVNFAKENLQRVLLEHLYSTSSSLRLADYSNTFGLHILDCL